MRNAPLSNRLPRSDLPSGDVVSSDLSSGEDLSGERAGPLSIGITCYPSVGGSGIIATEVGLAMAARGHRVHFITNEVPARLDARNAVGPVPAEGYLLAENVWFHPVVARDYPVFPNPPYALALASSMVSVATAQNLDVLHVHYAIPHATSAWMAGEVLGPKRPRIITTLHGTDITLVGADPSYLPITRHSVLKSDAVTAPSNFLRDETWSRLNLSPAEVPIEVIANFVDVMRFRPLAPGAERTHLCRIFGSEVADLPVLVHVSNFRAVKRVPDVVRAFAKVVAQRPARLLLIGEGPERPAVAALVAELGLSDRVRMLDTTDDLEGVLRECSVFVLPSETESFGLAALEALASGVPVVASNVGGLPEVLRPETGTLVPLGDVSALAAAVLDLLSDSRLPAARLAARADVMARFRHEPLTAQYEALYRRVVAGAPVV
jgi:N-acetyl-alpha-D-glucosaminyl L-malate synthase BshA